MKVQGFRLFHPPLRSRMRRRSTCLFVRNRDLVMMIFFCSVFASVPFSLSNKSDVARAIFYGRKCKIRICCEMSRERENANNNKKTVPSEPRLTCDERHRITSLFLDHRDKKLWA